MTDILIRNVPSDVVAAIDARAKEAGLSRSEYLRRTLARDGARRRHAVTTADIARLSTLARDLDDPDVMSQAWR